MCLPFVSSYPAGPAEGIGPGTPLDAGQLVIEFLGQLANLAAVDLVAHIAPAQGTDGRDNGGGVRGRKEDRRLPVYPA